MGLAQKAEREFFRPKVVSVKFSYFGGKIKF